MDSQIVLYGFTDLIQSRECGLIECKRNFYLCSSFMSLKAQKCFPFLGANVQHVSTGNNAMKLPN